MNAFEAIIFAKGRVVELYFAVSAFEFLRTSASVTAALAVTKFRNLSNNISDLTSCSNSGTLMSPAEAGFILVLSNELPSERNT